MEYYQKHDNKIVCLLCSYYCHLKEEQVGACGVNKNVNNALECLVYGYPSALNIDPIEKKPLYHFIPASKSLSIGTVGCNFRCEFCQNHTLSQEREVDKRQYLSPQDVVKLALDNECESISYTYNEPTIFYPYARDIAIEAKKHGLKNVYVSNGFESKEVIDDMTGLIDAVNIDLKSFDPQYYKKSLGGNLDVVLTNLRYFHEQGIWTEVTTLLVPTKNDSEEEIREMATFIKEAMSKYTPWHISAFHPNYKELELPPTSVSSLKTAYNIAKEVGLKYVYLGNANLENSTYCKECGEMLIKRITFDMLGDRLIKGTCPTCNEPLDGIFKDS